ncbi:MAG: hypothetical protein QNJ20_00340 [Paracoccaceae bacterium]|nr:hypothetical protein [Paracoccaceae bacterium]
MTEISDSPVPLIKKIEDAAIVTFGLAILPVVFLVAPRFAIGLARDSFAVSVNIPANADYFSANRKFSDTDTARFEALIQSLKEKLDTDDWVGLAAQLETLDKSREALDQSDIRLSDLALDYIRHDLSDAIYAPNMCNFDHYYEILDPNLQRLEAASRKNPANPYLTALLAQAHIDRGWCARGGGWAHEVTEQGWDDLMRSFQTAHMLLERFDVRDLGSPFYARVKFQLMVTLEADDGLEIAREAYQDWSDMDISNPLPHRHFSFFTLPRWFGNWPLFEEEATRAAERTRHNSGKAAYARFYLEAFDHDGDAALSCMDVEFFHDALEDLITGAPDPVLNAVKAIATLNEVVATEPITLIGELLDRQLFRKRKSLKLIIRHLLDSHITHLPTEDGSDIEEQIMQAINRAYQPELKEGLHLSFTPDGIRMVPLESEARD